MEIVKKAVMSPHIGDMTVRRGDVTENRGRDGRGTVTAIQHNHGPCGTSHAHAHAAPTNLRHTLMTCVRSPYGRETHPRPGFVPLQSPHSSPQPGLHSPNCAGGILPPTCACSPAPHVCHMAVTRRCGPSASPATPKPFEHSRSRAALHTAGASCEKARSSRTRARCIWPCAA